MGRPISHPQVQPRAHCRPPPSLPPPGHALNACLSWNQTGWKTGRLKIRLDQDMGGKKGIWLQFWSRFFLTLTAYALYQCDQTSKSGRVNLNRCAGSQMLIHGYKQPHGPFTLSLRGWNWWNSNQKQKSLVLKPSVPLPSGLRCSLSPMTRLTKLWIPIPIPLPGERNA